EHPIEEESLAPIVSQEEDSIPVRKYVRTHKAPDRLCLNVEINPDPLCFNVEVEEYSLGDLYEPANYKAALSDAEFEKWLVAMNAEMQSMYDNKVLRLVVLPPNAKVVKSKWIYKNKADMNGKVHIYKARLVAKGCTQTYGVDYEETFSPIAGIRAIRILIVIAAYYDYEIWQIDLEYAFLNGFLEEEIYIWNNLKVLLILIIPEKYVSFKDSFMDLSKHQEAGIRDLMRKSKELKRMQNDPYASAVGSIMYVVRCTIPDVAFAQNITSQFQQNSELRVNCYCNARFETDRDDTKSQTSVVPSNDYPIKMNCNNCATIIMAKESGIQKGARHFKRKYHYVRECIKTGEIDIVKVHTDDNLEEWVFILLVVSCNLYFSI
nr:putative retrotransposon Ty1-copia subclass protein [Tanacetum cinerariifolium]